VISVVVWEVLEVEDSVVPVKEVADVADSDVKLEVPVVLDTVVVTGEVVVGVVVVAHAQGHCSAAISQSAKAHQCGLQAVVTVVVVHEHRHSSRATAQSASGHQKGSHVFVRVSVVMVPVVVEVSVRQAQGHIETLSSNVQSTLSQNSGPQYPVLLVVSVCVWVPVKVVDIVVVSVVQKQGHSSRALRSVQSANSQ
jgi:hypothetical protein